MEWNQIQSTKGGTIAVFASGANGGQWSARIEDIDKSSSHDESWDMGKEEELIGRK